MKKLVGTFIFAIGVICLGFAQEKEKENSKVEIGLEGMLGMTFAENFFSVNVGGPNLLLRINSDFKFGVGAYPSFFVRDSKSGARLAVGPRIDFKNFVLFSSFFHFDRTDEWLGSFGIGYKFHGKK